MPLCVKLFRQRWYVVGKAWRSGQTMVFSLDRIREFRPSSHSFEYPDDFDAQVFFEGCIGVIAGVDSKLENIKLKVDSVQANYLRDLPIHRSQEEIERNDEYSIFQLYLRPTFDFEQEILWNGESMEVLEPLWLRNKIARRVERMWRAYHREESRNSQ